MKLINTQLVHFSVALNAGTNVKDVTVPAGYSYRLTSVRLTNPDAAGRNAFVNVYDGANNLTGVTLIIALAAGAIRDAFSDQTQTVTGGNTYWAKAGSIIRATWTGMTGGNSASLEYAYEIWKEGDSTKEAALG